MIDHVTHCSSSAAAWQHAAVGPGPAAQEKTLHATRTRTRIRAHSHMHIHTQIHIPWELLAAPSALTPSMSRPAPRRRPATTHEHRSKSAKAGRGAALRGAACGAASVCAAAAAHRRVERCRIEAFGKRERVDGVVTLKHVEERLGVLVLEAFVELLRPVDRLRLRPVLHERTRVMQQ